ncbi:MAG: hypothetical protein J4431_00300 [Candidatus Aenigmarchaeota archaeon]|nr:hypothetical protein [Candidatus Aenigmarchaeota archaeon]
MAKEETARMEMHILNKLYRQTNIGEDYIPFHDILQGLKPHERSMKTAKDAVKNLHKKALVEFHKNSDCISLHRKNVQEIERILREYNGL